MCEWIYWVLYERGYTEKECMIELIYRVLKVWGYFDKGWKIEGMHSSSVL